MDPISWLGLLVFFTFSFSQLYVFYSHAYGNREGWTSVMEGFTEKLRYASFPGAFFLIFFVTFDTLRATTAFVAWKILYENMTNPIETPTADGNTNAICATFFVSTITSVLWTKNFFTPPRPFFVSCFLWALIDFAAMATVDVYYYDLNQHLYGSPPATHIGPFIMAMIYTVFYSFVVLVYTFYCLFHTNDPMEELARTADLSNANVAREGPYKNSK